MERAEAIKIIKSATVYTPEEMEALETLIPELRESEDERVRKWLIQYIKDTHPIANYWNGAPTISDVLSWLEKQNHDGKKWITPAELNRLETLRYEAGFDAGVCSEKEKQKEQKPVLTAKEAWKEMRLEVYAQASGNRHEPNCSDDSTKMFSLCDIDEIFEIIGNSTVGPQPAERQQRIYSALWSVVVMTGDEEQNRRDWQYHTPRN